MPNGSVALWDILVNIQNGQLLAFSEQSRREKMCQLQYFAEYIFLLIPESLGPGANAVYDDT